MAATTNGYDLVGGIQIYAFDTNGLSQDLSGERTGEMLLQHGQERHALFGLAIRIDERFFDELIETGFREWAGHDAVLRLGRAACHTEMILGVGEDYVATTR